MGLGGGGYLIYQNFMRPTGTAMTLETAMVTKGLLDANVSASSSVSAAHDVSLTFGASGKVAEILVEVGDVVKAGQPLARLDTTDLQDAVTQAEISLAQAKISLAETKAGPSDADLAAAEASLRAARASYSEVAKGASAEEVEQAKVALRQAEVSLESAQSNYDRSGAAWRAEVANSSVTTNLWTAQAAYEAAKVSYNDVVSGATSSERSAAWAKVQQAQASLDKLKEQPTKESLALAEISVTQAELSLKQAQYNLEQATLTAPTAGTVTAINISVGTTASGVAMAISSLDALQIKLSLDESDVAAVKVGQTAHITLDVFDDGQLDGQVIYVAPAGSVSSGVVLYDVTVSLPKTELAVRPGMAADVEIVTVEGGETLLVPLTAVQRRGEQTFVMRQLKAGETPSAQGMGGGRPNASGTPGAMGPGGQMNGTRTAGGTGNWSGRSRSGNSSFGATGFTLVPVTLGAQSDTEVQVLSGLAEGDVVALMSTSSTTQTLPFGMPGEMPGGMPPDGGGMPEGGGAPGGAGGPP
jgi:HlyD family secretion protein